MWGGKEAGHWRSGEGGKKETEIRGIGETEKQEKEAGHNEETENR